MKRFILGLASAASLACRTVPSSHSTSCQPSQESQPKAEPFELSHLEGQYLLTFVSTSADRGRRSVTGRLTLFARDSLRLRPRRFDGTPNPNRIEPFWGAASIELGKVGAYVEGPTDAVDPAAPGVVVYAMQMRDSSWETGLSFGANRNRPDLIILDGAYLEAPVLEVTSTGFRGIWSASIGPTTYKAAGFFCAVRPNEH